MVVDAPMDGQNGQILWLQVTTSSRAGIVWHGLFSLLVVPPVLVSSPPGPSHRTILVCPADTQIFYFLRVYRLERRCIWLSILLAPLL